MSLQDVDDFEGALGEAGRVLEPGGRLCIAVVHPLNSAGRFDGDEPDSPFTIVGSYLERSFYADDLARDGLEITFVSAHRPLEAYTEALSGPACSWSACASRPCPSPRSPDPEAAAGSACRCFSTSERSSHRMSTTSTLVRRIE
ncbi:MAG: hypothetical protein ACR2M2_07030 [Gaiellaceae bacterium]